MSEKTIGRAAGLRIALCTREGHDELRAGGQRLSSPGATVLDPKILDAGGEQAVRWTEVRAADGFETTEQLYSVLGPDGAFTAPRPAPTQIHLHTGSFDPTRRSAARTGVAGEPGEAQGPQLRIVQLATQTLPGFREELERHGVELGGYVPDDAFLCLVPAERLAEVARLPFVRALAPVRPEEKCGESTRASLAAPAEDSAPEPYELVALTPDHKAAVAAQVAELGGTVVSNPADGGLLLRAALTPSQLARVAAMDEVTWIDRATAIGADVDLARVYGGAAHVEQVAGYTGRGLRGHVLEGIEQSHPEFAADEHRQAPIPVGDPSSTSHGTCTYGIIYGSGKPNPKARGILPEAQGYYTNQAGLEAGTESRFELTKKLVEEHKVLLQTASWGHAQKKEYDAISAELDDLIFRLDLPVTQSQSNTGTQNSRPEAWAKNVISVGALKHFDNLKQSDDQWQKTGSIGPAKDGRIKPDLAAWYDKTFTTGLDGGYRPDFGGTSGATPTINGYLGLIIQMWTDGIFGNPLPVPAGEDADTRFANRPHFSTVKALAIASAQQWEFRGATADRTRVHQGWGFPDVKRLYEQRDKVFAVNESRVLAPLESARYELQVEPGEPTLKVSLVYPDPVGAVAAARQRVNDLDLKVTAPDGTVYWGNHGLLSELFSSPGGEPNKVDTVENVFVKEPAPGTWTVEVIAAEVNQDGHLETPELDVDFGLAVIGVKRP